MTTHPYYNGQCVLLKWFRTQEDYCASWSQLRAVCKSLDEFLLESQDFNYFHRYVYPLVAMGLLEYGENKIGLSRPVMLRYPTKSILINHPAFQNYLEEKEMISSFSSHVIYLHAQSLKKIKDSTVKSQSISGSELLSLPDFNLIIESWDKTDFDRTELSEFQILTKWGWQNLNHDNQYIDGLYKAADEYGARRYLYKKGIWYIIPTHLKNPDGSRIAYSKAIYANQLSYNKDNQSLTINTFMFPLIVQRMLFRISGFSFEYQGEELMFNNITQSNFNRLNMIMYGK